MNNNKLFSAFRVIIFSGIICSIMSFNISKIIPESESACGSIYGIIKNGKAELVANETYIKQNINAYWYVKEKIHVTVTKIAIKYAPNTPFIYLLIYGKRDEAPNSSVNLAVTLKQNGSNLLLNCDGYVSICKGEPCNACDFDFKPSGEMSGCKCESKKENSCNHTLISRIEDDLVKYLPRGK